MNKRWQEVRDVLLFLGGMAGVYHETVIQTGERPTLLILFAAMMGLPAFLQADRLRQQAGPPARTGEQVQQGQQPGQLPPADPAPAEAPPEGGQQP